ncbi:MAG: hypothetical protein EOP84_00945 [Verrucomicrobiaceae bacterium]|nr:MAG: hypothetical protein EOP84_00945 [Verrucomicrobiaceae bacterium]
MRDGIMLDGDFRVLHPCGLRIDRGLDEKEVARAYGSAPEEMGNGFVWYHFPPAAVEGGVLAAGLCFHGNVLVTVGLRVAEAGTPGDGWDRWSAAEERECVRRTGKWLRSLGYKPGNYRWCEIRLGYDSRTGSGGAVVSLHQ